MVGSLLIFLCPEAEIIMLSERIACRVGALPAEGEPRKCNEREELVLVNYMKMVYTGTAIV